MQQANVENEMQGTLHCFATDHDRETFGEAPKQRDHQIVWPEVRIFSRSDVGRTGAFRFNGLTDAVTTLSLNGDHIPAEVPSGIAIPCGGIPDEVQRTYIFTHDWFKCIRFAGRLKGKMGSVCSERGKLACAALSEDDLSMAL
jgi:hypothetical protein